MFKKLADISINSVKLKMILSVGTAITLIISLTTMASIAITRRQIIRLTQEKVESMSKLIESPIVHAMLEKRPRELDKILGMVASLRDIEIESARLFKKDGTIVSSSNAEEEGQKIYKEDMEAFKKGKNFVIYTNPEGIRTISLLRVIENRPDCHRCHDPKEKIRAILNLHLPVGSLEKELAFDRSLRILSAIVSLFLMAIVGYWLHTKLIDKPLEELGDKMSRVEAGDLSARIEINNNDELGRLGKCFNSMIQKLKEAQEQIMRYHEEHMLRADRLASLGELASRLAHEIKTPLAGISSALKVLAEEVAEEDPKKDIFGEMQSQIKSLTNFIDNLLSYAKTPKPCLMQVNLNDILDSTIVLLNQPLKDKDIELELKLYPNLFLALADPEQMRQVFLNILLNAIQAAHQGGNIQIATSNLNRGTLWDGRPASEDGVRVTIRDDGEGISPEALPKIFIPFYTTKAKGTGLGLANAKKIVEEHSGKIAVESTAGKGTTFTIVIPAAEFVLFTPVAPGEL